MLYIFVWYVTLKKPVQRSAENKVYFIFLLSLTTYLMLILKCLFDTVVIVTYCSVIAFAIS